MSPNYDYVPIQGTAYDLISKYGQTVTLTRTTRIAYTNKEGGFLADEEEAESLQAIVQAGPDVPADPQQVMSTRNLVVASKDVVLAPQIGDHLSFDDKDWNVSQVVEVNPGGTRLIWNLTVGRI